MARRRNAAWFRHRDDGFSTVWVLGLSVIVLVLGTAVFDVWQVFGTQRTLTARVDAAAAAGAQALDVTAYQQTPAHLKLVEGDASLAGSAVNLAKVRLEEDFGVGNVTVSCAGEPDPGKVIVCFTVDNTTHPGEPTITVTVKQRVEFTVFKLLGHGSQTVSASGTAGPR